jgi:hypothetical protein
MKRIAALILVFFFTAGLTVYKSADDWVFRSTKDFVRSAIEVWPTSGKAVTQHAKAEIVLYRKSYNGGSYERMNWSAMNDNEPHFRFGVERGNVDVHRAIWFCFERPETEIGLPAKCPFILEADGETVHITGKLYVNGVLIQ